MRATRRFFLSCAAVVLSTAGSRIAGQVEAPAPRLTEVFIAGEGGYHTFRIPSVIATAKGTLLAFAEGRRDSAGDAGDIDLVLKRSRDGGASWSALRVVADEGPQRIGDPCPVVDRRTGTIWLVSSQSLGTDNEAAIIGGTSQGGRTIWVQQSRDEGETWSARVEITADVKPRDWTWYATGPGVGIQTRAGRLVIPANHAIAGTGVHHSHIIYSDDGVNWHVGGSADAGTNESQVVELADGRLMLNMRNHPPRRPANFRMVATSADGGRTWSPAEPDLDLVEPPAQASLLSMPRAASWSGAADRPRLLFSNPASARRERMTVRLSEDEGASWPVSRVIYEGPAAYSCLAVLPGNDVGLLFERGERSPYETITFARFTLAWLMGGRN